MRETYSTPLNSVLCWTGRSRDPRRTGWSLLELSEPLLEEARLIEATEPQGIRYLPGDASTSDWWDRDPFDGVVCTMALMDIDDLGATLQVVRTVLRAGGWFHFSLLHPCFPGERTPTGEALPSWPPSGGYAAEGWWSTRSTGVRGHVGAHHRTLSTYLNAILAAGLQLTALAEPDPVLPRILIIDGRRPE